MTDRRESKDSGNDTWIFADEDVGNEETEFTMDEPTVRNAGGVALRIFFKNP